MMSLKMKKVSLIIARADFENVLRDIIIMGCLEATAPDEFQPFDDSGAIPIRETVELEKYSAHQDTISVIGTQYALSLTGWITARSEQELVSQLSKYICAYEIENPSQDELADVPIKLRWPKLFGIFKKNAGKQFCPLASRV